MKKISTLFKKDPSDLGRVINEINTENEWVLTDPSVKATRKWDGTACAIINGELYKRYDVKKGKSVPENAIPCQEADEITGHWPHWVKCDRENNGDKWHFEAFDRMSYDEIIDCTYELLGPKIQGNPEKFTHHVLVEHGGVVFIEKPIYFEQLKDILSSSDIEGIVYHQPLTGKMCKIRKSDFGIKR